MLGLGPGSAGAQSSGKALPKDAYAASLQAEADDLAAITGDIGAGDDWAAQAAQYAALQAQILRDMQARDAVAADEYAEQDPELARLLGMGLDLGEDDAGNDDPGLGLGNLGIFSSPSGQTGTAGKAAAASAPVVAAAPPSTAQTSTVMSAADLEAQLMGMEVPTAPAPAAAPSAPSKGIPKLLSVEDMAPVPFPPGWKVGMPLPAGTFLIFDEEEEEEAAAPPAPAPAVASSAPLQQVPYPVGPSPPMTGQPQPQQAGTGAYPPLPYAGPMGAMATGGMPPLPGLLHPQALQAMQYQYHQLVQAIQARPGQPIPAQIQEQLHFLQMSLQRHMMAMQHLNAMHAQQVAAQAGAGGVPPPALPMPGTPQPAQPMPPVQQAGGVQAGQQGASFAQAAGGQQGKAAGSEGVTILQRRQEVPLPTAGAIGARAPLPPGAAPPLPLGAPPASSAAAGPASKPQPVTMATLLTAKVPPPRALQGKSRMSIGDILTVCRSMFNQLAALDPFTECYYALVLQTKKAAAAAAEAEAARRFALGLPPLPAASGTAGGAGGMRMERGGNILDVAATLTEIGDRALSLSLAASGKDKEGKGGAGKGGSSATPGKKEKGGRGGNSGKGSRGGQGPREGKEGKEGAEEAQTAPPAPPAAAVGSDGTEGEPQLSAAAALIASLPVQSVTMRNLRANQLDLKKLHAVKRRLWEQHNSVLGRQESINIRAPKRTLNLSDTGTTTADELRAGEEHVSAARAVAAKEAGSGSGSGASAHHHHHHSQQHEGSGGGEGASAEVPPTAAAQLWAVRARIDAAHEGILALQEAARKHQGILRAHPPPPRDVVQGGRAEVNYRRANLAEIAGFTLVPEDAPHAGAGAAAIGGYTVDDAVLSAMLTLPKGKKVLSRLVPMLEPGARVAAVAACMRLLPYCVASATAGSDYEAADAALSSALSGWVSSVTPPPPAPAASSTPSLTPLAMITAWVDALRAAHSGSIIKALLQHPGASDVIATLLQRGTAQVAALEAAGAGKEEGAQAQAQAADLTAWKESTEALGKAFVEAE